MTYRILLVEDNVQICRMIGDYFSAQTDNLCELDTVQNGADGLDAAQSGNYDLIMLDVMLPDLDGFSICRSIRSVSDVPLLFLTARAREEDVLYGYTLGCDDYVAELRRYIANEKKDLREALESLGARVVPSDANFFLLRTEREDLADVREKESDIVVRRAGNFPGLDDHWVRVAVRTRDDDQTLIRALKEVLAHG